MDPLNRTYNNIVFIQLKSAHNRICLGQVLYKVVKHLGITHKYWYICIHVHVQTESTSILTSDNDTMMDEFGCLITSKTRKPFDGAKQWLW